MKEVWWRGQGSGTRTFCAEGELLQCLSTALAACLQERVVEYYSHHIITIYIQIIDHIYVW